MDILWMTLLWNILLTRQFYSINFFYLNMRLNNSPNLNISNGAINSSQKPNSFMARFLDSNKMVEQNKKDVFVKSTPSDISFGSKALYKVMLRVKNPSGDYESVPALFTRVLQTNNKKFQNLIQDWIKKDEYSLATFFPGAKGRKMPTQNFYALEMKNTKNIHKNATAIMSTSDVVVDGQKALKIDILQSTPKVAKQSFEDVSYLNNDIKGSGELMLYGAIKEAKAKGCKVLTLESSNDPFYQKMGMSHMTIDDTSVFRLYESQFDDFLARVEKKYQM